MTYIKRKNLLVKTFLTNSQFKQSYTNRFLGR
jgi:hypothetical protein